MRFFSFNAWIAIGPSHPICYWVHDDAEIKLGSPRSRGDASPTSDIMYPSAIPFVLVHLACFGAIWTGVTLEAGAIGVGLYRHRIFAIGANYHRYFSHRAYETSRVFQFVLAVLSQTTAQKSVLWWAANHRDHHLYSASWSSMRAGR